MGALPEYMPSPVCSEMELAAILAGEGGSDGLPGRKDLEDHPSVIFQL